MKMNLALAAAFILLTSCTSYHLGTTSPYLSKVYVDTIINKTEEPQVGSQMHRALAEQLSTTPSKESDEAPCKLDIVVTDLDNKSLARTETRDRDARDEKSDAYQTVLYRITIKVNYTLSNKKGTLLSGTVTGIGDLPKMHDRNVPLQYAIKLASDDAARKIVAAIADMEPSKN